MDAEQPVHQTQPSSTQIDVLEDGRMIIRAEIASRAQLAALKALIDGLAEKDPFSEDGG
jgi:hypothetical protein